MRGVVRGGDGAARCVCSSRRGGSPVLFVGLPRLPAKLRERQFAPRCFDGALPRRLASSRDARPGCVGRRPAGTDPGPSTGAPCALGLAIHTEQRLQSAVRAPDARIYRSGRVALQRCDSIATKRATVFAPAAATAQLNCCTSNSLQLTRRRRRSARKLQPWCTSRSSSRI